MATKARSARDAHIYISNGQSSPPVMQANCYMGALLLEGGHPPRGQLCPCNMLCAVRGCECVRPHVNGRVAQLARGFESARGYVYVCVCVCVCVCECVCVSVCVCVCV